MADKIEDLPVLQLTDEIARGMAGSAVVQESHYYRTALRIAEGLSDEALIAEVRRRGYGVLGEADKKKAEEAYEQGWADREEVIRSGSSNT